VGKAVAVRLLCAVLAGVLLGGCAQRSPARSPGLGIAPSGWRTYHLGQQWDEPPGWRVAVTGIRCGATASLAPGDTDADRVCLVAVTFANETARALPFTGTADDPGPTWRVSAYDADGAEFHGHARQVAPTPPGASGGTDLVFEVPPGPPLRRVLLAQGMVDLT
jgi:hypothetical protein